jgi:hypothetical protein
MKRAHGPQTVLKVHRSELRQNQSQIFRRATGRNIVQVCGRGTADEKYLVDKAYFDGAIEELKSAIETLQVMADQRLFQQVLRAGATLDDDIRLGRLHSLEEAFGNEHRLRNRPDRAGARRRKKAAKEPQE